MANANTLVSVFGLKPQRIGGGEMLAREVSAQLAARGWHHVLCFLDVPREPVRGFLEGPNVSLRVIEDCWKTGWKPLRQLSAILREFRPKILHLNYTGFLSPYPWLARFRSVEKVFFTDQSSRPAGYVPGRYPSWKRALSRIVNRPVTNVICVSNYGYRCFTAMDLLPADRFAMIYNAVDVSRADAGLANGNAFRHRFAIPEGRMVVAQASWMIPEKGIADLLEAARLVLAEEPGSHFLLAGSGAHLEEYKKAAEQFGIASHVTFTGMLDDPLTDGLFAGSDIVCQMSRWGEVFGYVIAEAMASYRPVIGTDVGGIPEVIADGVSGFIVKRGDARAMADRLVELLRDEKLRARMGQAGRRRAEELFNLKTNARKLVELYGIIA